MLSRGLRSIFKPSALTQTPKRFINHIKNMNEEHMRAKAEAMVHEPGVIATDRVYKPTYTIEFNREG